MPAVTADRFLDALRQSGLLAADRLDAQLRRAAAEGPPEDAAELAARFVRDGLLTAYQVDRLLQGRWQDLVIAGKYAVLAPIGAGGMGQVYLTEHVVLRRRSAVKVLPARLTDDPAAVERFRREAQAVAALDHPNIVRAYDVDTADGLHFLVMEYVAGLSLQELVGGIGPIETAAAANYVAQAARGLQHAHEAGWVHRDIKPANLLIDRAGTIKVLDLGLARLLGDDAEPLTGATDALGTADYLAPEQGTDSHAADIRADIYSLGATFYFLLTGRPPFPEGTPAQRVLAHQTRPPRPVRDLRPDVPAGLAAVLDRMLAKDPAGRYPTPAVVVDALKPWADGDTCPPPTQLLSIGLSGSRSGPQSSWARHAGLSGSHPRPAPRRPIPAPAAETVAGPVPKAVPARPKREPIRRSWPMIAGGFLTVAAVVVGILLNRPKPPTAASEPIGEVRKFVGHTGAIENVAFTPDGTRLVTVSQDKTARVWDVPTGQVLKTLTGATDAIRGLAVLPDNRRAVTAGWGGSVRLWDLDEGVEIRRYVGHKGQVWWAACDADGKRLLTTGEDRTIRLWDIESGAELKKLTGHLDIVTAAVFLPDGRRAVSASLDHTVRLWDLETGRQLKAMGGPKMVYRLSLCPKGRWVHFGCDKDLVRWDPDGSHHVTKVPSSEAVEGAVCLPDGRLALAMLDGTIRVWETDPDREVHQFPGNGLAMLTLAVAPDGKHIASGGRDKIARIWNLPPK
jgi:serine/threonine protein kinase